MKNWSIGWRIVFWVGVVVVGLLVLFGLLWAFKVVKIGPQNAEVEKVKENTVYVEVTSIPQPKVIPATEVPMKPAATNVDCHIIHDSVVVETMDSVSTSGDFIHLEFWYEGQPEREAIFTAAEANGGRFMFERSLKGWVWEYKNCSYDEVYQQVQLHITRRLEGKANNAGFIDWKSTGLFKPVPLS